jgi:hypothetical protein
MGPTMCLSQRLILSPLRRTFRSLELTQITASTYAVCNNGLLGLVLQVS